VPEPPPAPKTEVHLKPVWNGLDQPIWIISTTRHSPVSRIVEQSPSYTRFWKSDWGWEIDHSEFRELSERLRVAHTLCPQCLAGVGDECDGAIWKLFKIGCRPRKPDEKRAPRDEQRYQYTPPPREKTRSSYSRRDWREGGDQKFWDDFFSGSSRSSQPAGMSPAEAAGVLGLTWPIDRAGAGAAIKAAFSKAALAAHPSVGELSDEQSISRSNEAMKRVIEARKVLNEWAGIE
jgi:hypothetical protein